MNQTNYIKANIEAEAKTNFYAAFNHVYRIDKKSTAKKWLLGILFALILLLFLPWTQNIRATGNITTLRQEQRPQQLNTIIPGRVVKWYVKEGDFVKAGDTVIQLAEIKDDYFDPDLLIRTQEQIASKELAVTGYQNKAGAAASQMEALMQGRNLKVSQIENKIRQQRLKVQADSMDMLAAQNDFNIASLQYSRQKSMFDSGLVSLTQLEQRNQVYQNFMAKKTSAEIRFTNSRQELVILQLELNGTIQDYTDKISKAQGDQFASLSQVASGQADIAKLKNQYSNYNIRSQLYFIKAPQDGQVIQAKKAGIGEVVKDGEMIVEVVPTDITYAVEMFVQPLDLPLINIGQKVRFVFDGFPAIVFSGWPAASYGTFGGIVVAVETSVTDNGLFRVLIKEDPNEKPWPKQLRMGGGAKGIALLKDIHIWYELWRQINGFPPDYYLPTSGSGKENGKAIKK
jgi:multidrug resistance efflux pump